MWPITKPKRITPVRAITILRPREDRRKPGAGVMSRALLAFLVRGGTHTSSGGCSRPPLKPPSHVAAATQRRRALRVPRTVFHFMRGRGRGANSSGPRGGGEVAGGDVRLLAEQLAQEHALEGRLLVDAVVVGAADETAHHLRIAGARFAVVCARKMRSEHAGAGDTAVAGLEHDVRFVPVEGLEPGE